MNCIVMAGGRGARMNIKGEKLLLPYKQPIILHVIEALSSSGVLESVRAAVSRNAPQTAALLEERGIEIIMTSGSGYSSDLACALKQSAGGILIVSGDMPLLDGGIIRRIVSLYNGRAWTSILARCDFLKRHDLAGSVQVKYGGVKYFHTGISLVNADIIKDEEDVMEHYEIIDDLRVAFSVNTKRDYDMLPKLVLH